MRPYADGYEQISGWAAVFARAAKAAKRDCLPVVDTRGNVCGYFTLLAKRTGTVAAFTGLVYDFTCTLAVLTGDCCLYYTEG